MAIKFNPISGQFDLVDYTWERGDFTGQDSFLYPTGSDIWGIRLIPDGYTFTAVDPTNNDAFFSIESDITMDDNGSSIPPMVKFDSQVTLDQSLNAFGSGFLFWARPQIKNNSGVSGLNMGPFYGLGLQPFITADTGTFSQVLATDILMQATFST